MEPTDTKKHADMTTALASISLSLSLSLSLPLSPSLSIYIYLSPLSTAPFPVLHRIGVVGAPHGADTPEQEHPTCSKKPQAGSDMYLLSLFHDPWEFNVPMTELRLLLC